MTKSTTKSSKSARKTKKPTGYSGTPLLKKLGMKAGQRVMFIDEPPHFQDLLGEMPLLGRYEGNKPSDYVHLFVKKRAHLQPFLQNIKEGIAQDGMVWVSWPKKSAKVDTDITEDVIRELALPLGLVDVKVCAIDETWSALKLVIRRKNRKK